MRRFGYWLGVAFLVLGSAAALAELFTILQGAPSTLGVGEIWFRAHANSLVGFQSLIENRLSPAVWPPIQWLLSVSLWLLLVPPGLALVFLCRERTRF